MSALGTCPSCGRKLAVNPDGTLRPHRIFNAALPPTAWATCPGRKPAPTATPQRKERP